MMKKLFSRSHKVISAPLNKLLTTSTPTSSTTRRRSSCNNSSPHTLMALPQDHLSALSWWITSTHNSRGSLRCLEIWSSLLSVVSSSTSRQQPSPAFPHGRTSHRIATAPQFWERSTHEIFLQYMVSRPRLRARVSRSITLASSTQWIPTTARKGYHSGQNGGRGSSCSTSRRSAMTCWLMTSGWTPIIILILLRRACIFEVVWGRKKRFL